MGTIDKSSSVKNSEFLIKSYPRDGQDHNVYLSDSTADPEKYNELVDFFKSLVPSDIVNMYIANNGGNCSGCISLVNAIKSCEAKIHVVVTAPCFSAGSTIALSGNSLVLQPHTFLMFHNYSNNISWMKGNEQLDYIHNTDRWIKDYFKNLHSPFLTLKEINELFTDKDLYIHYNDDSLEQRLRRHFKLTGGKK